MNATGFQGIFAALAQLPLSGEEIATLQTWVNAIDAPRRCLMLINEAADGRPCPHCGATRRHRCGQANGLQRYRCLGCRHSFNALTGTPLARLRHRDKWLPYLQCVLDSRTVRAAAQQVAVAKSTSFRWRHRFISGIRRAPRPQLHGIVEVDETFVLESQKGSRHLDRPPRKRGGKAQRRGIRNEHDCILVARDRTKATCDFHAGRGPIDAQRLALHLKPVLAPDVLLVSDSAKAYGAFARAARISHQAINVRAGVRARGAIHLQNVNGWHSRFKTWLRRFHGVASRYLANYTGWQRVLDAAALTTPAQWLRTAITACPDS